MMVLLCHIVVYRLINGFIGYFKNIQIATLFKVKFFMPIIKIFALGENDKDS